MIKMQPTPRIQCQSGISASPATEIGREQGFRRGARLGSFFVLILSIATLSGCGSSIHDSAAPGPVDQSLLKNARLEDEQRLAGEDVRVIPIYETPLQAIGSGLEAVFIDPFVKLSDYMSHDTPAAAARKMLDPSGTPDLHREGALRLVDFRYAHNGASVLAYAHLARHGEDYTVRAAGLRALNRCRAKGYTSLFLEALSEEDGPALLRLEAADCLSNIPDPNAISLLVVHVGTAETDSDVRVACADALRCYNTPEVMRALVDQLDGTDFSVAWQARQSLELITGQDFRYEPKAWLNFLASMRTTG
jgi:hypothetical protein